MTNSIESKSFFFKFSANLEVDAFYTNEKIRTMPAGIKPSIVYKKFHEIEKFFCLKFSAA